MTKLRIVVYLFLSLVASHDVRGDSLNLNSIPLLPSLFSAYPQYHDAAYKAQEAFLAQAGITSNIDKATSKATTTINNTIPVDTHLTYLIGGVTYTILVRKQATEHFKDPFVDSITHTVTVSKDSASTGIQVPLF